MSKRREEFRTFLQDVSFAFVFVIFNVVCAILIFRDELF
jgi:hypothetical protein